MQPGQRGAGRRQEDELGGGNLVHGAVLWPIPPRRHAHPFPDDIVQIRRAHGAHRVTELHRGDQADQHGQARFAIRAVQRQVAEIVDELFAVRQAAQWIDTADSMAQFDLHHRHGGQVLQGAALFRRDGARRHAQHAQRAERETVRWWSAAHRRKTARRPAPGGCFLWTGCSSRSGTTSTSAVSVTTAQGAPSRAHCMCATPTRDLKPLAVAVRQRNGGHGQLEQLRRHACDAVKGRRWWPCRAGRGGAARQGARIR